jgi:hypothetical protein
MSGAVFSPDGNWMWTGTEWIQAPPSSQNQQPQQLAPQASISISDSIIQGAVSQFTQHTESIGSQSIQIQDTVVMGDVVHNTYVTNTVNQELMNYVMTEIQNLKLNIDSLRAGIDSSNKKQIKDKITLDKIDQLNKTVRTAELSSGTAMLNKKVYEILSTVAISANASEAGYMTNAYGSRVETREEEFDLVKRKIKLSRWCYDYAQARTPEAFKHYIDVGNIYLKTRDKRITELSAFQYMSMMNWPYMRFMHIYTRLYEIGASIDPNIPSWSELPSLRTKARTIYLQVKAAKKQSSHTLLG